MMTDTPTETGCNSADKAKKLQDSKLDVVIPVFGHLWRALGRMLVRIYTLIWFLAQFPDTLCVFVGNKNQFVKLFGIPVDAAHVLYCLAGLTAFFFVANQLTNYYFQHYINNDGIRIPAVIVTLQKYGVLDVVFCLALLISTFSAFLGKVNLFSYIVELQFGSQVMLQASFLIQCLAIFSAFQIILSVYNTQSTVVKKIHDQNKKDLESPNSSTQQVIADGLTCSKSQSTKRQSFFNMLMHDVYDHLPAFLFITGVVLVLMPTPAFVSAILWYPVCAALVLGSLYANYRMDCDEAIKPPALFLHGSQNGSFNNLTPPTGYSVETERKKTLHPASSQPLNMNH